VVRVIDPRIRSGDRVLHVSVHSFTPVWEGRDREVDVGVLFDPARPLEASLARAWVDELRRRLPELRTKPNEPYHGAADGLTTGLRRRYPEQRYFGLELEVTQRITRRSSPERRSAYRRIVEALLAVQVRETRSVGGGE
jgi:predicted N-formylglutamate amidohydrolase